MTKAFFKADTPDEIGFLQAAFCPQHVIENAVRTKRKVIRIVWDESYIPEHAKGFVQWSTRPYCVTDTCDGTRDGVCFFMGLRLCERLGLNISQLFDKAYPKEAGYFADKDNLAYLALLKDEIEMPKQINSGVLRQFLYSLRSMNHRSLADVLEDAFLGGGYAVDEYYSVA